MNRKLLLRVATPPVLAGLFLCTICLLAAWHVNRLQTALADILAENVLGMKAAQQLEISARQLRFHSFLFLIDPREAVWKEIETDRNQFEDWLGKAAPSARTPTEQSLLREIHERYDTYWRDFEEARRQRQEGNQNVVALAAAHSVRPLTEPCRDLLRQNEEALDEAVRRSEEVTNRLQATLLLLGLGGPLGGLLSGFGIARGVGRSLHRLSVRVQDVAQQLDQDVADVQIAPGSDLRDLDRQLDHVVARVTEATERFQRQQREMLRAQQLAAVGQLAASIAHEVRNPLTAIKMLVEAALRADRPKPVTSDGLRIVHDEVLRLERTVQGLLDFARPQSPNRRPVDLRTMLGRAMDLTRARARQQRVEVAVEAPESIVASVDEDQLCSVFVNLFVNALDAMPAGGRLSARLESAPDGVRIVVEDTGPGISPAMRDKLFSPFESDKPTGCGLGLSVVKRVVEQHGGSVAAENTTEGGARFVVTLPVGKE
jgi:signal transduction histidine kinase